MIPFVDAHVHFWQLDRVAYPWLTPPFADDGPNGSVAPIARDYRPADHRDAVAAWNLAGAVHVEAGADPAAALDETGWLEEQAAAHGLPDAIVAWVALDRPGVADALAAQARHPRVRGVRQIVGSHSDARRSYTAADVTVTDAWRAGFATLAQHGLSFDLQCYPGQMPGLVPLLTANDAVPVIVNHLGMPVLDDPDGIADWRRGMRALAALPHVSVKISGLGFIARDWTPDRVGPLVRETIELFGTGRCMIASDAPTDTLFAPLERYLDAYRQLTDAYSLDERRDVWGRNANRIYRIGLEL